MIHYNQADIQFRFFKLFSDGNDPTSQQLNIYNQMYKNNRKMAYIILLASYYRINIITTLLV